MRVPLYDHALLYRRLQPELDAAVGRVLASGRIDWGPETPAFEQAFAAWLGVSHVVGTNSGTAAIKAALLALDIGPGAEVITVPNTDISTTAAIRFVGARPVWVDVEPDTCNMDPNLAEAAISAKTKVILPVDLYGHPADLPALRDICDRHGLSLVEDACLALGAAIGGRRVGQWADITCFSFAPSKHLGAYGSAGAAATDDAALMQRLQSIVASGQGRDRHYQGALAGRELRHENEGLNERLDEIQAALLQVKLPYLRARIDYYIACARTYSRVLSDSDIRLPMVRPGCTHTFRNYVVHVSDRQRIQAALAEQEIATAVPYAPPLHLQPAYRELGYGRGSFSVAERLGDSLLSLPIGSHIEQGDCEYVAACLLAAL